MTGIVREQRSTSHRLHPILTLATKQALCQVQIMRSQAPAAAAPPSSKTSLRDIAFIHPALVYQPAKCSAQMRGTDFLKTLSKVQSADIPELSRCRMQHCPTARPSHKEEFHCSLHSTFFSMERKTGNAFSDRGEPWQASAVVREAVWLSCRPVLMSWHSLRELRLHFRDTADCRWNLNS